jgi:hypothetical protein
LPSVRGDRRRLSAGLGRLRAMEGPSARSSLPAIAMAALAPVVRDFAAMLEPRDAG